MFQKLLRWLRAQIGTLFGDAPGANDIILSGQMENALALWAQMYETGGPWCTAKNDLHSLHIAASVAREFARLVTMELEVSLSGSPRADYLAEQLAPFLDKLPNYTEIACALGGAVFKPYVSGDRLLVDVVQGDCFFPTTFDTTGRLTGAIFSEQLKRKNTIYTRLERHEYAAGVQTIQNKAFASSSTASLGQEIPLADVPEWADIAPEVRIEVERPLFAYFRIPLANRNDRHSPLGASVYAPAVDTIHDADEQFGRLLWEYEGGQLAIDVDAAALRPTGDGGVQMDQRSGRLYRGCMTGNVADRTLFNVFAPALRDEAYLRGLDGILKRIEFQCGLAYGTLSDPQNVDKTATEIMASKQRSYSTVKSIQHALQVALDDLLYAMNAYADLYQLVPAGSYTAVYNWDDSIVNDPSERKQLFWQYVQAGKFPMQRYLTEFEGYSQEEAAQIAAETSAENNADETLTFIP